MSAPIDPVVVSAANRGKRVGVLLLVEKDGVRGVGPLAIEGNLRTLAARTCEVNDSAKAFLLEPSARTDEVDAGGAVPLAHVVPARLAARSEYESGGIVLENLGAVMGAIEPSSLERVGQLRGVRKIIPIPRFMPLVEPLQYSLAQPADLRGGATKTLRQIHVPALWDSDLLGDGITIGHFDTGINAGHPAFSTLVSTRRLRYAAFGVDGRRIARARRRDVDIGTFVHHGTHTAGTLVGNAVSDVQIGIAPNARLVSVQIFPQPQPTPGEQDQIVINALNWIVGERPDVINLSFGDVRYNNSYLDVIGELIDQNITVVAAVGNSGANTSSSPGNYPRVISVGAIDGRAQVCAFSGSATVRRSARPDICAPGVRVLSAGQGEEFAFSRGTSAAAPHVAGVVALLKQRRPDLTPQAVKTLLKRCASQPVGWDESRGGAGIVDGKRLLAAV